MKNIAIIHFQPIEKYPPITNLLNYLAANTLDTKVTIFTTKVPNGFKKFELENINLKIYRFGDVDSRSTYKRIISYIFFYFVTFIKLVLLKPQSILYYETMSALPAFWYNLLKRKVHFYIHYHEYTTPEEYQSNSGLVKWLHKKEQQLYKKAFWISHTNKERLDMFLKDENIFFDKHIHKTMPNYPPLKWINSNSNFSFNLDVIKFIYIGSLGLETMYLKEIAAFIISQNGKALLDIYTNQFNNEALEYIKKLNTKYINIKGSVNYENIPNIIKKGNYHVGLIIYKGHIKNYIYNAPNKLFEYLACDLNVWYPNIMSGCKPYKNTDSFPIVFEVDFTNINTYNYEFMLALKNNTNTNATKYYYESVYTNIAGSLLNRLSV